MDNRLNEIRRKISILPGEMTHVEKTMHDQITHDLNSTEAALRLMAMRAELATLVAEWKAAGGGEPLRPSRSLKANNRPLQKPKASVRH
jgi:chorismate mutase